MRTFRFFFKQRIDENVSIRTTALRPLLMLSQNIEILSFFAKKGQLTKKTLRNRYQNCLGARALGDGLVYWVVLT